MKKIAIMLIAIAGCMSLYACKGTVDVTTTPSNTTIPVTSTPGVTPTTTIPGTVVTGNSTTTVPSTTVPSTTVTVPTTTVTPTTGVPSTTVPTTTVTLPGTTTTIPSTTTGTTTTKPSTTTSTTTTKPSTTTSTTTTKPSTTTSTTTTKPSTTDPSTTTGTTSTKPGDVVAKGEVNITLFGGHLESAYLEWDKVTGAEGYNVYYQEIGDSKFTQIDNELIREYPENYRADIVGLKAGDYNIKVAPIYNGKEYAKYSMVSVEVVAHDRAGFAFVNGTSSGAYNEDGTLKSNANVIYVTNENKDTISLTVNNENCVGVQNIIYGYKKREEKRPLDIRFIGNITDFAVMEKGDLLVDDCEGITIEGIGEDAVANGWGLRIKNSTNIEVRNLGFMNCDSDEGDNIGLQQGNDHIWVHNNDLFYGNAGSDADQIKGDGALDTKTSTYVTHSYNHFWDNGKSNLQGMKSESTENMITYHHNWFDHSDSRHPRVRTCTVHVYNNYYDGNAKYGIGATMGASIFSEANYFRNTSKPMMSSMQGTDAQGEGTFSGENGGMIKSYGDVMTGKYSFITHKQSATSFDAYLASSRDEQVPSSYKTLQGGTTYNNFDTSKDMYSYNVQTAEDARDTVMQYAGRVNGGDLQYEFNDAVEDSNYTVIDELKQMVVNYESDLVSVGGNSIYGAEIENPTSAADVDALIQALPSNVTLADKEAVMRAKYEYDALLDSEKSKVTLYNRLIEAIETISNIEINNVVDLINDIGTVHEGSLVQINAAFDAYNALTKEQQAKVGNYDILLKAYSDYQNIAASAVVSQINKLPSTITIADKEQINTIVEMYNELTAEQKKLVTNYDKLVAAVERIEYLEAPTKVIELINQIGAVTINSGDAIDSALNAYNALDAEQKKLVTNYDTLAAAKAEYDKLIESSHVINFNEKLSDDFFTTTKSKVDLVGDGTVVEYEGYTYNQGLKLNSEGKVTFTTTSEQTITIYIMVRHAYTEKGSVLIDNQTFDVEGGLTVTKITTTISAGDHTIVRANKELVLLKIELS